jgi:hypothetical protein
MWFYMYWDRVTSSLGDRLVRSARRGGSRRWSACTLGALTLLGSLILGGCEDPFASRSDGAGFWRGDPRDGRQSARDFPRHRRHGRGAADARDTGAGAGADAGGAGDAGDAGDAGLSVGGDAATAASSGANAGLVDAGASTPTADAGADPAVQALNDGQILLVIDTLLGGSIDQAAAALPSLVDADTIGFAEQIVDEDTAARDTLAAVANAIGASPAESAVAASARATIAGVLEQLVEPDAGALDGAFIDTQIAALTRTLPLMEQLAEAADAPVLRAQLVVLHAVEQARLERARQIAAGL